MFYGTHMNLKIFEKFYLTQAQLFIFFKIPSNNINSLWDITNVILLMDNTS